MVTYLFHSVGSSTIVCIVIVEYEITDYFKERQYYVSYKHFYCKSLYKEGRLMYKTNAQTFTLHAFNTSHTSFYHKQWLYSILAIYGGIVSGYRNFICLFWVCFSQRYRVGASQTTSEGKLGRNTVTVTVIQNLKKKFSRTKNNSQEDWNQHLKIIHNLQ